MKEVITCRLLTTLSPSLEHQEKKYTHVPTGESYIAKLYAALKQIAVFIMHRILCGNSTNNEFLILLLVIVQ